MNRSKTMAHEKHKLLILHNAKQRQHHHNHQQSCMDASVWEAGATEFS